MIADGKPEKNGVSSGNVQPIPAFNPPAKPKRNKYALACSFLASMTSILLGYRSDDWSNNLYPKEHLHDRRTRRSDHGNSEPVLASRHGCGRAHLRLDRPSLHHSLCRSDILCRGPAHGIRHRLRLPHGGPLRGRHRRRLCTDDCAGVHGGGGARFLPGLPHFFSGSVHQFWYTTRLCL